MHRAGPTPLVPTLSCRLELQLPQHVPHRDLLTNQMEVHARHCATSSPANREEAPELESAGSQTLAAEPNDSCRLSPGGFVCPDRQGSPVLNILHIIVAVRRITATRTIFEPR